MKTSASKSSSVEVRWREMGFKPQTIQLLFVVPLVQVAWAEGFVQRTERRAVLRLAADLKIMPEHESYQILLDWLNFRPTDEFFEGANGLLRDWLDRMPPRQSESLRNVLLIGCLEVARSSALIGLQPTKERICRSERRQLEHLGKQFGFAPVMAA